MQRRNNVFHPNAMRTLDTLAPKRYVYKPKKAKKPSTLKKRILLERLKKQLILQLKQEKEKELQEQLEDDLNNVNKKKVIHLYHLTDDIQFDDEDELQEIIRNIQEILIPFQPLKRLAIHGVANSTSSSGHTGDEVAVKSYVEIEFYRNSSAESAVKLLNGLVIAGTAIVAVFTSPMSTTPSTLIASTEATIDQIHVTMKEDEEGGGGKRNEDRILVLRNLITSDDIEDEEALIETLNDIQTLSQPFQQGLHSIWIEHASRITMPHRLPWQDVNQDDLIITTTADDVGKENLFNFPLTLLELSDLTLACGITDGLQGTVIGGNALQVGITTHKLNYAKHWQCPILNKLELMNGKEGYRCSIMIHDFVAYEQVENEDERQEIVEDIRSIFATACSTSDGNEYSIDKILFILSPDETLSSTSSVHVVVTIKCKNIDLNTTVAADGEGEQSEQAIVDATNVAGDQTTKKSNGKQKKHPAPPLFKAVTSLKEHAHIASALHETVIGGANLRTSVVYVNEDFVMNDNIDANEEASLMSFEDFNAVSLCASTVDGHCMIAVSQFITQEDIDDEVVSLQDPDTIATCKRDFLHLLVDKNLITSSLLCEKLVKVTISIPASPTVPVSMKSNATASSTEYLLCLRFSGDIGKSLSEALTYFDGLLVSGVHMDAEIELASNHDMTKSIICVNVADQKRMSSIQQGNNENMSPLLLPADRYACVFQEEYPLPVATGSDEAANNHGSTTVIDESAITIPHGRYKIAKQAPKLQIHRNPEKAIPVATEEINAIIKEFLKMISTFQQRLKEKNPTKVKQKLRFVAGIKQSLTGVKAKKARIVFIAPNTEASEELDSRLDELVNQANQREIPVVYCLSKRLLGKAVQMTIKQSVITVFDPDGAYDLFKKIIRFVVPS